MSRVSMTWPQYWRRECAVDGVRVRLTPMEAELVLLLLISPPDRVVDYATIIEGLWPNPDTQALTAINTAHVRLVKLRRKGVPIETDWGWGLRIPAEARGGSRTPWRHALDRWAA